MVAPRLAFAASLLALWGCEERLAFDSAAWKAEAGRRLSTSVRPAMLSDLKQRFPAGSTKTEVLAALGPSEHQFEDICAEEPRADECLFYSAGAEYVDSYVIVLAFENDRLVSSWRREL